MFPVLSAWGVVRLLGLVASDDAMKKSKSLYHGHRFPAGVISGVVRCYHRYQLSLRDIEELLFERGVIVIYEVARSERARCRTRHPAAKAARHDRCQTLLQACAALEPGAA
jgi:transposase-like protein